MEQFNEINCLTPKEKKNCFFCTKCRKVPLLKMNEETNIEIYCPFIKKPGHNGNVSLSQTNLNLNRDSNELISSLNLEQFIKEIEVHRKTPQCESKTKQHNNSSEIFCPECRKWFCDTCIKDHNKNFPNHIVFKSNGLVINPFCENKGCKGKNKVKFYCEECEIHLCYNCSDIHKNNRHNVIDISHIADDEIKSELLTKIDMVTQRMKYKTESYEQLFNELQNKINICKDLLVDKTTENNNIIKYFKSLIATYDMTKGYFNYNIFQNLRSNDILRISNSREKEFDNVINYQFNNSIDTVQFNTQQQFSQYLHFKAEFEINDSHVNKPVKILGDNFYGLNDCNCLMLIDGKKIPYRKDYNFSRKGKHQVEIQLKEGYQITDMSFMFYDCSLMSNINLAGLRTYGVKEMVGMFYNCTSLSNLDISKFDTKLVTDMSYMFDGCTKLSKLNLHGLDTSSLVNMECMFYGCEKLTELDLSSFNTSRVKQMEYLFYGCSRLTTLDLSSFNTVRVINMSSMFMYCSKLTYLNLSNFKTPNVTNISCMFSHCAKLSKIELDQFDNSSVVDMKNVVDGCGKLSRDVRNKLKGTECLIF